MNLPQKLLAAGIMAGAVASVGAPADATAIYTASGTQGGRAVSASAAFTISGNQLTIVLQNTSPAASPSETPTNTLTGIAFLLNGANPLLTPMTASAAKILNPGACSPASACTGANVNVGGEFGYQNGFSYGGLHNAEAIGSAGYITTGIPHNIGNFNGGLAGTDLDNHQSLGGIDFGIVSNTFGSPNGGLNGQPLVQDTVTFTLLGVSSFLESQIGSVLFLYGTAPDGALGGSLQPCLGLTCGGTTGEIPEPGTMALFGAGLMGLAAAGRRKAR